MKRFRRFFCSSLLWLLLAPTAFIGAGAASNQLVLIANNDRFPVMANSVHLKQMSLMDSGTFTESGQPIDGMLDDVHCVMTNNTHLNFLADIFDVHDAVYSIGDFSLMLGERLDYFCFPAWVLIMLRKQWEDTI